MYNLLLSAPHLHRYIFTAGPYQRFLSAVSSRVQFFVHDKLPVKEPSIAFSEALQREVFFRVRCAGVQFFLHTKGQYEKLGGNAKNLHLAFSNTELRAVWTIDLQDG